MTDLAAIKTAVYGTSRSGVPFSERKGGDAVTAFERESLQALTVKPISSDTLRTRREDKKAFIVKTLLFIGLYPRDRGFPILVTVLEKMSDSFEFDDIIRVIADNSGNTPQAVEKLAVGQFDLTGDREQVDAVRYITGATPNTALDAIYDLALYFKKVNFEDGEKYE